MPSGFKLHKQQSNRVISLPVNSTKGSESRKIEAKLIKAWDGTTGRSGLNLIGRIWPDGLVFSRPRSCLGRRLSTQRPVVANTCKIKIKAFVICTVGPSTLQSCIFPHAHQLVSARFDVLCDVMVGQLTLIQQSNIQTNGCDCQLYKQWRRVAESLWRTFVI